MKSTNKVDGNVTDMIHLPCIIAAHKTPATGEIFYELQTGEKNGQKYAHNGDILHIDDAEFELEKCSPYL